MPGKVTGKVTFTDFEDYNVDNFEGGVIIQSNTDIYYKVDTLG